jgi:hypothetical protein
MAMAMAMNVASAQALLAVSAPRQIGSFRHCAVALPPLRFKAAAAALPRRLVVVRATSQVDTGSTSSSKATVPDNEISITKVWFRAIESSSSFAEFGSFWNLAGNVVVLLVWEFRGSGIVLDQPEKGLLVLQRNENVGYVIVVLGFFELRLISSPGMRMV